MDSLQIIEQKLTNIENSLTASKEVLTFDGFCQLTGFSRSYAYKLTSAGIVPHSKPNGKNLFFDRTLVQAWMLSKPIKTSAEINTEAANYVTLKKGR